MSGFRFLDSFRADGAVLAETALLQTAAAAMLVARANGMPVSLRGDVATDSDQIKIHGKYAFL